MQASTTVARSEQSAMSIPRLAPGMSLDHLRTLAAGFGKVMLALIGVSLVIAMPASAQSLNDIETQLYKKEQFFQPVNTAAPTFALRDADDHPWDLGKLKGTVIVLQFIYGGCKDVCPLLVFSARCITGIRFRSPST